MALFSVIYNGAQAYTDDLHGAPVDRGNQPLCAAYARDAPSSAAEDGRGSFN